MIKFFGVFFFSADRIFLEVRKPPSQDFFFQNQIQCLICRNNFPAQKNQKGNNSEIFVFTFETELLKSYATPKKAPVDPKKE